MVLFQNFSAHQLPPHSRLTTKYLLQEAEKRGYTILKSPQSNFYKIINPGNKKKIFFLMNYFLHDLSISGHKITKYKHFAYQLLLHHKVPTPLTFIFRSEEKFQKIVAENFASATKIVIKAEDLGLGEHVYIVTPNKAAAKAKLLLKKYGKGLIQEFFSGKDLRIQAVGGRLFAACTRIPAHVIGNGRNSVADLIKQKNLAKAKISAKNIIVIDEELKKLLTQQGLTMESIPPARKHIQLKNIANIGQGGDPVDVTDKLHPDYAKLVKKLARLLHMKIFAVDILCHDYSEGLKNGNAVVLEINAPCMWGHHHFAIGQKRNVAGAILDCFVGESKFNPQDSKYLL